jgi:type II secretory pathway component PulC
LVTFEAALQLIKSEANNIGIKKIKRENEIIEKNTKFERKSSKIELNPKAQTKNEEIKNVSKVEIIKSISLKGENSKDIGGLMDLLDSDEDVIE